MKWQWEIRIGNTWYAGTDANVYLTLGSNQTTEEAEDSDPSPMNDKPRMKGRSAAVMARNKLTLGGIKCITDSKSRQAAHGMPERTPTST